MGGPLAGVRAVELAGRGPGPFGAMMLADLGAEVVRVCRVEDVGAGDAGSADGESGSADGGSGSADGGSGSADGGSGSADGGSAGGVERMIAGRRRIDLVTRGRRSIAADLKHPDGLAAVRRLIEQADVLIEGFRPGVAERLGIGPSACLALNPRLVYARITGWGQDGPYASTPGHDINYVALAGALDPLRAEPGAAPAPPLNMLGDYGGGGMLLAVGILSALVERSRSGRGQVVDAAMIDGVALLTTLFHGMRAEGLWSDVPGTNVLDLGAPFYNVYETADGRYVTVGCGEPQFYASLLRRLGLSPELAKAQADPGSWAPGRAELAAVFKTKTLGEWCALLEGTDTCFAPVLTLGEAPAHPHNVSRGTFTTVDGVVQPAPAPRFSRTPAATVGALPASPGQDTARVLLDWGFARAEVDALLGAGAVAQAGRAEAGRAEAEAR